MVDPSVAYEPGDEVVVSLKNGECGVWCFDRFKDGLLQFRHVNETGSPFTLDEAEIETCHKVIGMAPASVLIRG